MRDPRRYVDASTVPYIVVPESVRLRAKGIVLGCRASVTNKYTGASVQAVVADVGPALGEMSIAAAKAIGVNPDPRRGGDSRIAYHYEFWPGQPAELRIGGMLTTFFLIRA